MMYVTGGSTVFALEPETGKPIWTYVASGRGQPARRGVLAGRFHDARRGCSPAPAMAA